jgi:hypothetical protein
MECPTLTKPELKQLCRWTGLKKVPFMKIQAGEVTTKEGITLVNKLGTCRELDSIRAFFTTDEHKTYPGVRAKDPSDPTNRLKGLCTYTINTFTIGKPAEKIGFEVTFPPEPEPEPEVIPSAPTKKHVIGGVDITFSPKIQEVEIKEKPLRPNPTEQAELVPLPPPRPARPTQATQGEEAPSSRPPARTPPPVPSAQSAWENEENEAAPSQLPAPKLTLKSELEERLQRQRARADAQ